MVEGHTPAEHRMAEEERRRAGDGMRAEVRTLAERRKAEVEHHMAEEHTPAEDERHKAEEVHTLAGHHRAEEHRTVEGDMQEEERSKRAEEVARSILVKVHRQAAAAGAVVSDPAFIRSPFLASS